MSLSISSAAVSRNKARPIASMRPASSSDSVLIMCAPLVVNVMASLCHAKKALPTCKPGICLEAAFGSDVEAPQ